MNARFEKIAQYIKDKCVADDFSLNVDATDSHETRFAQNGITQHLAGPKLDIRLEVSFDAKTGTCSVNQDDPESLDFMIRTAEEMAKLNRPDPEYIPSAAAQDLPGVNNCDAATKELDPAQMVNIVQDVIKRAKGFDATVSGMTEKHYSQKMLVTRNGFFGYDENTEFGHSMTLKKGDVETKVSYDAKQFAGFDAASEFQRLQDQAEGLRTMQSFDPCKIAVILRPSALQELMWFMGWMMNRRQSDEGFTPFTGKLGEQFFGEKFSWHSTLNDPRMIARPFGGSGIAAKEITWVENGVIRNMPTNRFWAHKHNLEAMDVYNVSVPGGDVSEAEMMKLVPRGLIINRFWYIRTVDAKAGELTGMTRDGVLYFENGEIKHAVNNLRFNEIPHLATRRILAMGPSVLSSSYMCLPTMLIDDYNFVDKTSF